MSSTFIGYCGRHDKSYQTQRGCPICLAEHRCQPYDDERNFAINHAGHDPEYTSSYHCPGCGRYLVWFAVDQLYYCRACEQEYTWKEVEA